MATPAARPAPPAPAATDAASSSPSTSTAAQPAEPTRRAADGTPRPAGSDAGGQPATNAARSAPAGGAPDTGARVGHDVATAPALPSSAPKLNLELARPRGGELSGRRTMGGVLPVMPRPPELPDKLAKDIEKSARPDCRTAHADKGLLAVPALAADALKDNGCRW